jgi:cytoskeletal protein CcmA (bactofilin family)
MARTIVQEDSFINSIVGEGTRFKGALELNGLLRVDGDFSGSIKTDGKVLIGKNGRADCTINAATVVIGGVVRGNIFSSEKVIVLSSAMIIGNVRSPRLIVEEGVVMNGEFQITGTHSVPDNESDTAGMSDRENKNGRWLFNNSRNDKKLPSGTEVAARNVMIENG